MLFNSDIFIFCFLPIVAIFFFVIATFSNLCAAGWLVLASLFFYGWWSPKAVPLLVISILVNYAFGYAISECKVNSGAIRKRLLCVSVAGNLALLGYFKYANFFASNVNAIAGSNMNLGEIILPLGISFFTFTQIAFLVDTFRRQASEYRLVHYALFVTYFPHLIAGPILHHKEMMPQFGRPETYRFSHENVAIGTTIFFIGLFKKVVLADGLIPYVGPAFDAASRGEVLTVFDALPAALAYTLQLYFDFSGYSDMAVGASRIFGIVLPLNFNSPYKAESIIDFWRRWHMTLSRFLRDYLYIAIGGNRMGTVRRYAHLMITMVLGGLWHGAGWTFVVWGALHGVFLVANHAWRGLMGRSGVGIFGQSPLSVWLARALTFAAVVVAWIFFRAADLGAAIEMLKGIVGINGLGVPQNVALHFGINVEMIPKYYQGRNSLLHITTLLLICWFWPNTQEIVRQGQAVSDQESLERPKHSLLVWQPSRVWVLIMLALAWGTVTRLNQVSEFLYFQF